MDMPESMDACLYFTRRVFDPKGKLIAWARKQTCPKCKKGLMGKPRDDKTGRAKIRSTEYVCAACGFTESKEEHEPKCTVEVMYTCPSCEHKGEETLPYKRKKFKGVDAFIFECASCKEKIAITKKMKAPKVKK
ncbi:MAG: hypothetical protein H6502_00070 [Candidatus Woesearchaeota archaeon]|nr:MAG: hypothetical protein H6502_00070 [Candidatus Woesearchaeota archaeon]